MRWKTSGHEPQPHVVVQLEAAGVGLVVAVPDGRLPASRTGARRSARSTPSSRGDLAPRSSSSSAPTPSTCRCASRCCPSSHRLDGPPRPERFARRPGGHRASPSTGVEPGRRRRSRVSSPAAPGVLVVDAADEEAGLDAAAHLELLPTGLLRVPGARSTNTDAEPYALDDLVLAFPVPAEATELLDFAGRHNLERVPQRARVHRGTHLRENRKGRTGRGQRLRAARRHARLRFRRRPGVGRAHGVERQPHALRRAGVHRGAGDRRRRAAAARRGAAGRRARATEPVGLRRVRRTGWTRSPAASTATCARRPAGRAAATGR